MKIEVNSKHKSGRILNPVFKKNVTLIMLGAVIGVSIYSGCSKLKKSNSNNSDSSVLINNDNVTVEYSEDNNTYDVKDNDNNDVKDNDNKVSFSSFATILGVLGVSLTTNVVLYSKLKDKKSSSQEITSLIYNFDYGNSVGSKRRR